MCTDSSTNSEEPKNVSTFPFLFVMCFVSPVTFHVSQVTCHLSLTSRATATDLLPANSPTMNGGLACKELKPKKPSQKFFLV